jgi:hypothetical protein
MQLELSAWRGVRSKNSLFRITWHERNFSSVITYCSRLTESRQQFSRYRDDILHAYRSLRILEAFSKNFGWGGAKDYNPNILFQLTFLKLSR